MTTMHTSNGDRANGHDSASLAAVLQAVGSGENALGDLGTKIFFDRYALKDMSKQQLNAGDLVIVCTDTTTGQRELGAVAGIADGGVEVELRDGTTGVFKREHVVRPLEQHPAEMMARVARGIAAVEGEQAGEWEQNFRWLLEGWKFVPAGRILTGAGTEQQLTYFNCFVLPPLPDSRHGIFERLDQMAEIMSRGGGVGINISTLRPRFAHVAGVNGRSSGSVSWGALYSYVTGLVEQAGSRRGALMIILNCWHPDVLEFINSKRTMGQITNANISVAITDRFMEAVQADADWQLVFPDTAHADYDTLWDGNLDRWVEAGRPVKVHETVKARAIWDAIIESAWASAEPGVFFIDRANKMSNSYYYERGYLHCTNPCGEQPIAGWSVCNLGAINLAKFVGDGDVDWDNLARAIRYAVRFLDNVIDATPYFFGENEEQQKSERRIGLNTMGLAEMMIRLGIRYGSDESVRFIDRLYEFIASEAYFASAEIAAEKGAFPFFDADKFLQSGFMQTMPARVRQGVRQTGVRNVTLLTQAPNGTTGSMCGTSTGIEPFYHWSYVRKSRLGQHDVEVPVMREWKEAHTGEPLPAYFVTAMDLTPEEHIRVQAAVQRWVDASISKTANLPASYTVEQTRQLFELLYRSGCKGGTIYRDGSRDVQVLNLKEEEKPAVTASATTAAAERATLPPRKERPGELTGWTFRVEFDEQYLYVTINHDGTEILEVFAAGPLSGGVGMLASKMLRSACFTPEEIARSLNKITGTHTVVFNKRIITSPEQFFAECLLIAFRRLSGLPDSAHDVAAAETAGAAVIAPAHTGRKCPRCSGPRLARIESCDSCPDCGYSKCS